jgi:hypothetical protein
MNTWQGHHLVTRTTLEEVQRRIAADGALRAAHRSRVLVAAAGFWAAAANRALAEHLRPAPIAIMQSAGWAFTELWSFRAANAVYRGLEAMLDRPTPETLCFVVAALEDELVSLTADIDQNLEDYATEMALLRAPAAPSRPGGVGHHAHH